jgi:Lar family restriction alleviation protein
MYGVLRMNELLPCPFCGGEADIEYDSSWQTYAATCGDCGAQAEYAKEREDNYNAKAAGNWNRRYALQKNEHYRRGYTDALAKVNESIEKMKAKTK